MTPLTRRARIAAEIVAVIIIVALLVNLFLFPLRASAPTYNGPAGPLQPPQAALRVRDLHGATASKAKLTGLVRPSLAHRVRPAILGGGAYPIAVDLSQYAPAVGDQGQVNSCGAWVTAYYLRGWYANRDGNYPSGGFEPMFLYSQIVNGQNTGTTYDSEMNLIGAQGVATRSGYPQGDYDYTTHPTPAETAAALPYATHGWANLFEGDGQGQLARDAIESAMASGNPIGLSIPVFQNFENANAQSFFVDNPSAGQQPLGYHAVFAVKYDANGVWIENQWSTQWGLNGWAELSWQFIQTYAWQAVEEVMPPPTPAPLVQATPITSTSTMTPTIPMTVTPTMEPNMVMTPTVTVTPTITMTPTVPVGTATLPANPFQ